MKYSKHIGCVVAVAAILLMFFGLVSAASAAGTASGTVINNSATVAYQVGGISQSPVTSANVTFVVDTKVDLSVARTDSATVKVTPGSTNQVLSFTVTNTGNTTLDFSLGQLAVSSGTTNTADYDLNGVGDGDDTFDASNIRIFVENGTTAGFQAAEDTATFIDELAADASVTVYIVVDIDLARVNGDISSHYLIATAAEGGTAGSEGAVLTEDSGADNKDTVQVVFGDGPGSDVANDGARDGKHSSQNDFEVTTAALTVTKSSVVISDPLNNTTNPKRIPGAVVEYSIIITNTAGTQATNITVMDDLSVESATLSFEVDGYAAGRGIQVTAPNINGGAAQNLTNTADSDQGDYSVTTAGTVTVSGIVLNAGEQATVKFRVAVQ